MSSEEWPSVQQSEQPHLHNFSFVQPLFVQPPFTELPFNFYNTPFVPKKTLLQHPFCTTPLLYNTPSVQPPLSQHLFCTTSIYTHTLVQTPIYNPQLYYSPRNQPSIYTTPTFTTVTSHLHTPSVQLITHIQHYHQFG